MKYFTLLFGLFLTTQIYSQIQQFDSPSSGSTFTKNRGYTAEQGRKYNMENFYSHPDFGKLTFAAPYGKNVVEDISKRTSNSRYYIDLDDPTFFYIEQSAGAINTYVDGYWRAIDATLHQENSTRYKSGVQPCPTILDVAAKKTQIELGENTFGFNNFSLKIVDNNNQTTLAQANWSQIKVTNNGAYITEVFPGIDMRLIYKQGAIKSEFIIKQNLNVKRLSFIDNLEIPQNYSSHFMATENNAHESLLLKNNNTGIDEIEYSPAISYDASGLKQNWHNSFVLSNNLLEIVCDSVLLNNSSIVYPLTVDPLVTVVGPIASPNNLMGSLLSPAFCSHTINVTYPGGTTPWDLSASWEIRTTGLCYMSDSQVWFTSSCGGISPTGAPGIVWTCPGFGCMVSGTWNPILPFAADPSTRSLVQCYAPSCLNQTMNFTINFNRLYGAGNCTYTSSNCNRMFNWSVTLQGRNAETLSNTATGNGSQTIAAPTCASGTQLLNPTPQYGVPGYTYVWSTGATTPTITVPNAIGTYTCQVTDACGTVRTATFTITCPLGITLNDFEATLKETSVELTWNTESETELIQFDVLRAGSDLQFQKIGSVEANVTDLETYRFVDTNPLNGINYYQLAMLNQNNEVELSEIRSALTKDNPLRGLTVVPNPNKGSFSLDLLIQQEDTYVVEVIAADGRIFYQQEVLLKKGKQILPITAPSLEKGTYIARVRSGNNVFQEKFVVD